MTLLKSLKSDHDKAKALLAKILKTKDGAMRRKLFGQFATDMNAHSRAEEKVLYDRLMKDQKGKDEAQEGFVEHEVADRLIADLKKNHDSESDEWTARCTVLHEALEHHIEEEEEETFATARKLFDVKMLEKMDGEFLAEKAKHGGPVEKAAAE